MIERPTLLVLAAGMATRYGSLKQIDRFGPNGETIIDYTLYDAIKAGFGKVVFVIQKSFEEEFKEAVLNKFNGKILTEYVFQALDILPEGFSVPPNRTKPWGTGQAVLTAASKIQEPFAVVNADDFYGYESFKLIADFLINEANKQLFGLVGYQLKNTLSDHGAVSRGICDISPDGYLKGITEQTHIIKTANGIRITNDGNEEGFLKGDETVSMNLMGFTPAAFPFFEKYFKVFLKSQNPENIKAEFYLPEVVNKLVETEGISVKVLPSSEKWFGVTFKEDKPVAIQKLNSLIAEGIYPKNLWANLNDPI